MIGEVLCRLWPTFRYLIMNREVIDALDSSAGGLSTGRVTLAGLDLTALAAYLAAHRPELAPGPLTASLVAGGRSNLTYVVRSAPAGHSDQEQPSGTVEYVLRRPPLGHVLATAHDMAREYRVISALAPTAGAGARSRCCSARTPTCSARRST